MTRVLFCCWPFEGHVFPQMSMALALRERGHEVAFWTDASQRELVEGQGFELFPFRRVAPAWLRVHGTDRGTAGRRQALQQLRDAREWIIGTIPDQVADLRDVVAAYGPDVVGAEASMWGPTLLPETLPVPVALVSPLTGAELPGPDAPVPGGLAPRGSARAGALRAVAAQVTTLVTRRMRTRIDGYRADQGLGPLGGTVHEALGRLPLYLVLSTPELDYRRTDLPPNVHYVGACLWHPPEPPGTLAALDAIPAGRPWVHVTEGTSHFRDHVVLRAAAQGLGGGPYEAILTTGRGRDAATMGLGAPAANVHITDWLSHDVLLPRCRAIVTTGGMGTVMAALRDGVPLVVVPTDWDKPASAARIVAAGAGLRLMPRRCTPERLRDAVEEVLGDPRHLAGAQRAAQQLAAAPGPAGAARLIANLATTGGSAPRSTPFTRSAS
ncbi:glycosyltransferase [Baekduia soli]|uniref:Glycosyltransferase n=1 Tax=Baekduia soli TaxID=496014 RepID=A0A5B8U5G0_9ACTN|nr:nucleotide disphospho-sugar-binding domain-containing protein [Baekduia soli]QEC48334.1 glycosyltransferase [Baekduia soli]